MSPRSCRSGRFRPNAGEHVTLTEPCPSVTGGVSKLTATPAAFTVAREMPSTHASDGGFATGAAVAAAESALSGLSCTRRPAPAVTSQTRTQSAQYFTKFIDMN